MVLNGKANVRQDGDGLGRAKMSRRG